MLRNVTQNGPETGLSCGFCCCHETPWTTWEERVCFCLQLSGHAPSLREVRPGTQAEAQRPEGSTKDWPAPGLLSLLFTAPRTTCPCELVPPTPIRKTHSRLAHRPIYGGVFSAESSSLSRAGTKLINVRPKCKAQSHRIPTKQWGQQSLQQLVRHISKSIDIRRKTLINLTLSMSQAPKNINKVKSQPTE